MVSMHRAFFIAFTMGLSFSEAIIGSSRPKPQSGASINRSRFICFKATFNHPAISSTDSTRLLDVATAPKVIVL